MKIDFFLGIVSLLHSALLAYIMFVFTDGNDQQMAYTIMSGVCALTAVVPLMALKFESGRKATNVRMLALIFFIIYVISHAAMIFTGPALESYIIINGLIMLIYLGILYKLINVEEM